MLNLNTQDLMLLRLGLRDADERSIRQVQNSYDDIVKEYYQELHDRYTVIIKQINQELGE